MSNKSLVPAGFSLKMVTFETGEITPASSTGSFAAFIDAPQGQDYDLQFDVTSPTQNGHHWVTFRHFDQNNKYLVEWLSGQVHFEVHRAGIVTLGSAAPFALPAGAERHFLLQMRGFAFTLNQYDDSSGSRVLTPVLTWTDPASSFPAGPTVGIYSGGGESGTRWCDIAGTVVAAS